MFGDVDFILVPGDSVAHRVAAPNGGSDPDNLNYDAVKANLEATFAKFKQYFPNTMVLPTIGNNDGRFKDSAIPEENKADYDSLIYELWFTNLAGNSGLDLESIQTTVADGAYYRADVTDNITVLSLNSMYFDAKNQQLQPTVASNIMSFVEAQLELAQNESRKVIIMDHVYAGSSNDTPVPWFENYNEWYFTTLRNYADTILIEIFGHDHISDLRFHSSSGVWNLTDPSPEFNFHNMFVAPGITPYDGTNPGVSKFEISEDLQPMNLHIEFLYLF